MSDKTDCMATTTDHRVAPAIARDGVDTRPQGEKDLTTHLGGGDQGLGGQTAASHDEQIAALEEKLREMREAERELEEKRTSLEQELAEIVRKRKESMPELSEKQEKWLRQELTVAGKLLCSKDVMSGSLEIVDEDPAPESYDIGFYGRMSQVEHDEKKFSVEVSVKMCIEFQAGLLCEVKVKTKTPRVGDIVREMFEQTFGDPEDEGILRRRWDANYHYGRQSIVLRNPYEEK